MEASQDERRASERIEGIVLVELDKEGRHGVTRDISDRGLRIATRSVLTVGDRLDLSVRSTKAVVSVKARVVRIEKSPPHEAWPFYVALELDESLPRDLLDDGAATATLLGARLK